MKIKVTEHKVEKTKVETLPSDITFEREPSIEHYAFNRIFELDPINNKNLWMCSLLLDNVPSFRTVKNWDFDSKVVKLGVLEYRVISATGVGDTDTAILYIHGGGYISGSSRGYLGFLSKLSRESKLTVVAPDYELCPNVTQQHQVKQILALYMSLVKQGKQVIIGGDSAGGGLALGVTQALEQRHMPKALIIISPVADLACTGESYELNIPTDPLIRRYATDRVVEACAHHHSLSPNSSEVSFLYGSFENFPETYVIASEHERLYSDSVHIVKKLRASGCSVTFESAPYGLHVYPLFEDFVPEYKESFLRVVNFIKLCAS